MTRVTRTFAGLLCVLVVGAWATLAYSATVYYYKETFTGSGNPLDGKVPTISRSGAAWIAGPGIYDDGTLIHPQVGEPSGVAALLPFIPETGKVYTVEATILNTNPRWVAVGFLYPTPATWGGGPPPEERTWRDVAWYVRHSNVGYAWGLTRNHPTTNDQEMFNGLGTTGGAAFTQMNVLDPNLPVTIKIVLNTTGETWTATYFINGVQVAGPSNLPAGVMDPNTGIANVGISVERHDASTLTSTISYFALSYQVALLGDTNDDGVVDLADYNNVVNNLGATGPGQLGDTNGDEVVDLADYNNVVNNLGAVAGSSLAVPEPASLGILVLSGVLALARRRS